MKYWRIWWLDRRLWRLHLRSVYLRKQADVLEGYIKKQTAFSSGQLERLMKLRAELAVVQEKVSRTHSSLHKMYEALRVKK